MSLGVGAKASGSLISIWKEEVLSVDSVMQTQRVLAIKVLGASDGFVWVVANVYGPNVEAERLEFLGYWQTSNLSGMFRGS